MPSKLDTLLHRLTALLVGRRPATTTAPATAPAPRDPYRAAERADEPPAPPLEDELLCQLIQGVYGPNLFLKHGKSSVQPKMVRLDPPGLLTGWSIHGVSQWFWQYQCLNVILFQHDDRRYVHVPARRAETLAGACNLVEVSRLEEWSAANRFQAAKPKRLDSLRGSLVRGAPGEESWDDMIRLARGEIAPDPDDVDLAPLVHDDLLRAAHAGRVHQVLAFLDVLTTFRGIGSEELVPPCIVDRPEGIARSLDGRLSPEEVAIILQDLSAAAAGDGAAPYTAVVDSRRKTDGTSGGYVAELAVARLWIPPEGRWSYERERVWIEEEEGDALS